MSDKQIEEALDALATLESQPLVGGHGDTYSMGELYPTAFSKVRAALERQRVTGSIDSPWPARSCVMKLVEAADILLDQHDYDGDGWENFWQARKVAQDWLAATPEPDDA